MKRIKALLRYLRNRRNRNRLKNKDFSIISSNCVGGVMAHELGLRHNSPTVNLFLRPHDFVKLARNVKYYFCECCPTYDEALSKKCSYPVGRLDDIVLYFMHYSSFDEAKEKWAERCQRINWNNMYFIMCERDGCTLEDIETFDKLPLKHKVIFTKEDMPEIHSAYHIPKSQENSQVRDLCKYKHKFSGKRWLDDFDYVGFFNE